MSYHIIGIGGSGAKCIESLTHLCAAGLLPDGELNVFFIDPDISNGSLERAQSTILQYCDCKKITLGDTRLFRNRITVANPGVWSPFGERSNPTLEKFFHYSALKAQNESAAHLFDVLYSPQEKQVVLDEGFLGHPSIGAAVMAKNVKLGEGEPWKTFRDRVEVEAKSGGSKIILMGSIFGGTGAAGIPTIARLIREEFAGYENVKVGGVLLLPYFSFSSAEKKLNNGKIFKLNPENFTLNTQAALKYYHNQEYLDCFDFVYLIGEQALVNMKNTSAGGNTQTNAPHFVEIFASLAARDFFKNIDEKAQKKGYKERRYNMVARQNVNKLQWMDLPDDNGGNTAKKRLGRLTHFAFAYLNAYYPMLQDIRKNGNSYRAPWYVQFFERKKLSLEDDKVQEQLENMKSYCETFLKWFADIHKSTDELTVEFAQHTAFSERDDQVVRLLPAEKFKTQHFENLISLESKDDTDGLNTLWEKMCDAKVQDANADELGKFFNALFRECFISASSE
jgi:hypothetical protein